MTQLWAEKSTQPRAIQQQQYEYAYLFDAIWMAQKTAVDLVLPRVNTQAMHLHWQAIAKETAIERHVLVIADGALWHNDDACSGLYIISYF